MEWIITCKVEGKNSYKVFEAFEKLGAVDWHMSYLVTNMQVGDIVYIYVGVPYSKIMFKTKCVQLHVPKDELLDDREFGTELFDSNDTDIDCMRLQKIQLVDDDELCLKTLQEKGFVRGNIQGVFKSNNNVELFKHINYVFGKYDENEIDIEDYDYLNKPRINSKEEWVKILELEKKTTGFNFLDNVLIHIYNSPDRTIFCRDFEDVHKIKGLNLRIGEFRDRIKNVYGIEIKEQIRSDSQTDRAWNIPFKSSEEINNHPDNKGKFCWILREEVAEAIEEVYPELKKNKRVLFCNVAYMKNYDSLAFDEKPVNGGSYVVETQDAYEKYNFHVCEDGLVRGFVETKYSDGALGGQQKPKQLHIENIDKAFKKENVIDDVLVVFCALSPKINKTVIVGWYKNAKVYRNREVYNGRQYNLKTSYKDAILIGEKNRVFEVPRASQHKDNLGLGQANVWYANKIEHQDFVNSVIDYINHTEIKISKQNIDNKNIVEDDKLNDSIKHSHFDINYHFNYTDEIVPKPEAYETKKGAIYYKRDKKRAINALSHADYKCEYNPGHESFIRKNDGIRYTEAHHLIPMAYQDVFSVSLDIEENIISLCSNCHNEIHYGKNAHQLIEKLYYERKEHLKRKGIDISLDQLLLFYK